MLPLYRDLKNNHRTSCLRNQTSTVSTRHLFKRFASTEYSIISLLVTYCFSSREKGIHQIPQQTGIRVYRLFNANRKIAIPSLRTQEAIILATSMAI